MSNPIGNLGTVPTVTIGGTQLTGTQIPAGGTLITLHGRFGTATGTCTLRKGAATSGYQVTTGKTLTIVAFKIWNSASTAVAGSFLAQSDNDVGFNGTTALTNPVYMGTTAFAFLAPAATPITGGFNDFTYSTAFPVAATKYVTVGADSITGSASTAALVMAWGYEV